MLKLLMRYIFVGGLSLFPLILVVLVVNFIKDLGLSAYLSLYGVTNSIIITFGLMAAVLVLFIVLGYSIERYGKSFIVSLIDTIFEHIPAIRTIYSVSKKLSNMLSGRDESGKKEVVLVEYPKEDVWVVAYLLNRHGNVNVLFVPTSPNPTSGYTIMVKEEMIIRTSLSLEEASSLIISMGADFAKKEEIVNKITQHESNA